MLDDTFIRDAQGRALILRGVNVAHTAKRSRDGLPWVDKAAVLRLREDFGLNVIRLTMFWRYVEPARGKYDDAYLARIGDILDWAYAGDIHVVLDMHQDLFGFEATDLNEGDGVPAWARKADCPPFDDRTPWFSNYFAEPVQCQFNAFWANEAKIQDTFGDMWKHVAEQLGKHPAVVGVDLFTEPWMSSAVNEPSDALTPFYKRVIPKLRAAVPYLRVFYEPGTLSGSIQDQSIPKPDYPNMVYAPHYYPPKVFGNNSPYVSIVPDLQALHARHMEDATRDQVPLWIGEFGGGAESPNIAQFYRDLNAIWGPDFVGYARWSYDSTKEYDLSMLGEAGEELDHTTSMLEPYAERIPGLPTSTSVDMSARVLTLGLDAKAGGELVISCAKRFCDAGYDVTLTVEGEAVDAPKSSYDSKLGQVRVRLPQGKALLLTVTW